MPKNTETIHFEQEQYAAIRMEGDDPEMLKLWQMGFPEENVVLVERKRIPALIEALQKLITQ